LILSGTLHRRSRLADVSLALAVLLVGLLAAQIQYYRYPANHIWTYTSDSERFAQIEMKIVDSPRMIVSDPDDPRLLGPKQSARASAIAIRTLAGWRPAAGTISLYLEQLNPRLAVGQIVRATGMLSRPEGAMNPGEFDYAAWARSQRTLASLRVSHADGVEIVADPGSGPIDWLRQKGRHLLARGFNLNESYNHALLQAFVLGDSDPQLNDLEDKFVSTGTVHCMSVSGLHIAVAGGFVLLIGRLLRRSPRSSLIAAMIAVILYGLVATPTWPGWRSILMFGAYGIGLLARKRPDSIQLFCCAIAAILLIHPDDLTNGGFQISFAAVLGMILFGPHTLRWFWTTWRGPDAAALRAPVARNAALSAGRWVARFFVSALGATSIAWLMVIPLIAYHYGQLNTYSAPAGVIFLPITVIALEAGLAKIFLSLFWPGLSHVWAVACSAPVVCLRRMVEMLAHLPGSSLPLPTPPVWLLIVYYGLFAMALAPINRRVRKACPAVAVVAFFVLPLMGTGSTSGRLSVTLLSVGNGQCAVIVTPDHRAFLIDAGSSSVSDLRHRVIVPYLRSVGIANVDGMTLADDDYSHLSAATEIFENCGRPEGYTSEDFARFAIGNLPAENLLETVLESGKSPRVLSQGDELPLAAGARLEVLWPPADGNMNSNNCGLVLKLVYQGRSIIFPAAIEEEAEKQLLDNPGVLRCDILIAPRGGSAEKTTGALLRAARAQWIVASCSEKLSRKQRIFDSLASGRAFYRTSRWGAVTFEIDSDGRISEQIFLRDRTAK
jgi:competence protein ComEC